MSAVDARSVGELLLDADHLTRQMLLETSGDKARAWVRTWGEVVEAAADLWHAIPRASGGAGPGPMERLEASVRSIHRTCLSERWPGDGPRDEQMLTIAEAMTRAAGLVRGRNPEMRPTHSKRGRDDIAAARMRIMHTLYLGTHGVGVALREHLNDLHDHAAVSGASMSREPHGTVAARIRIGRFAAFEQLAGGYINGQYAQAVAGEVVPPPVLGHERLQEALGAWDIQLHRTLARDHSGPALTLVTRTQAVVTTTAGVLLDAAARTGHIDPDLYTQRLAGTLDASQQAWTHAATRWSDLAGPGMRTEPHLLDAAGETRAAAREIVHDKTTWATPSRIAARVDLPATLPALAQALTSAVEAAHVVREIAAKDQDLCGPARPLATRIRDELAAAENLEDKGVDFGGDAAWVSPLGVVSNRMVPVPSPIRAGLEASSVRALEAAEQAASAASPLTTHDPEHRPSFAPGRDLERRSLVFPGHVPWSAPAKASRR